MSFRVVESALEEIAANWKKALFITEQVSAAASQLEKTVNAYLRKDCNPSKLPLLQVLYTINYIFVTHSFYYIIILYCRV